MAAQTGLTDATTGDADADMAGAVNNLYGDILVV
jgi:hypothetical protein